MEEPRICIIGAGIGGASTAWHLRRMRPNCHITVMEQSDAVGGRLAGWQDDRVSNDPDDNSEAPTIELGGAIFHKVNETMVELSKACNLPLREPSRAQTYHTETEVYGSLPEVGVWNEQKGNWVLRAGGSMWGLFRLVWRYGLDLIRVSRHANAVKGALQKMYAEQRDKPNQPYCRSVEEMLSKSGLDSWAERTFSSLGYYPMFVAECLDPIARTIYSCGAAAINGYCGLAAVIAADGGGLYSCPGGNATIVAKLIELSDVSLILGHAVTSITPAIDGKHGWIVSASTCSGSIQQTCFDAVVLACPWEASRLQLDLALKTIELPKRPYTQMVVSLVAGMPALGEGLVPQTILSCGAGRHTGTFYSMGVVATMKSDGQDLWKVFSASPLTDADLALLFRPGYQMMLSHIWKDCFPDLAPQSKYPPMRIANGCYFANAMEALAPSMEAAAWCGKNVALITAGDLWIE